MKFLVSMYKKDEAFTEENKIENIKINAASAQIAANIARDNFPAYDVFKVVLICEDWN